MLLGVHLGSALLSVSILASAARGEIINLNCLDKEGAAAVSLVVDTDSKRIEQKETGRKTVQLTASQITNQNVRFSDSSGEFRISRNWNRTNGQLFSELIEGPQKGVATYWTCTRSN
jgi:hypothetical protein